jgi:hypothetical protein
MDARLIDLEIGFESVEFLVDGFDDGLGWHVVAVGEVYFHIGCRVDWQKMADQEKFA